MKRRKNPLKLANYKIIANYIIKGGVIFHKRHKIRKQIILPLFENWIDEQHFLRNLNKRNGIVSKTPPSIVKSYERFVR
jgi:hypothetical protein